ncbi:MAG: hypothetical protein ACRD3M_08195 [Thermoanaerobaculia bacterium]
MLVTAAALLSSACGRDASTRVAQRVLEEHRIAASVRPLPEAGSIRVLLTAASPAGGEAGTVEIEWEGARYRETVASAGIATVRGIQAGKAFFIDEDGVTRVGSEPMLAELATRSYFWRRAYLFTDRERAKLSLGPTDEATLSLRLRPRGGNSLRLVFDRKTSALVAAVSPRFHLEFESPTRIGDLSRIPARGQIIWIGLPTRRLPDPAVGGGHGAFSQPYAEAELSEEAGGVSFPGTIRGVEARLAIDANRSGPLVISPAFARKAGLSGRRDVFGRLLAEGVSLRVGALAMTALHAEIAEPGSDGIDAVAGGTLFRETVVEIDPSGRRLRLHDPARFVPPEGFGRNVLDDDGNLPVAILYRSGRRLRLRAGVRMPSPLAFPSSVSRELGLDPRRSTLSGLVWGTLRLPPVPALPDAIGFDPEWGDDGAVGTPLLLRFHAFVDMPHRWIYLKPDGLRAQEGQSER